MDQSTEVPIVIAHRGASGYLPEHTTESAAFAHALGADFIEQDCVLTRDGIPIVMHDLILDDLTDVQAQFPDRRRSDGHWHVMDFDLSELRQLQLFERRTATRAWKDAGTRFPLDCGAFTIRTLEEHLQLIQGLNRSRQREAGIYVEVKEPALHRAAGLDASSAILEVLRKYGYDSAAALAFVQCFDRDEVRRIRHELKCPLPLIWLTKSMPDDSEIASAARDCDGLGVLQTLVITGLTQESTPEVSSLVATAHEHGLQVHVWTFRTDALPDFVESPEELLEWLTVKAGVDGIFADQPDYVLQWRNRRLSDAKPGAPFRLLNAR